MKNERNDCNTDKIYERDAYIKTFTATVLDCEKKEDGRYGVILDVTAFFPEGGGQTSDTGLLGEAEVIDVQIEDDAIIHYTNVPVVTGSKITGKIDWDRRFRKMQNHSGEHLFCGLIHNTYGYDNVGFHMNDEEVTLDVNGELDENMLNEIEIRANKAIYEGADIIVTFPSKEEISSLEYRSKLDIEEGVRLVTIDGYDACACCAPHVANIKELGVLKVIDSFYHRGGTRITLRTGISAYEDYALIAKANKGLVGLLSSKRYDTYEFAKRSDDKYHELVEEYNRIKKLFAMAEAKKIIDDMETEEVTGTKIIFSDVFDRVQMRNVINEITERYSILVAGFIGTDKSGYDYIIGRGVSMDTNLSLFAKDINAAFNGSGGGKPEMIQGHLTGKKKEIEKFLENFEN